MEAHGRLRVGRGSPPGFSALGMVLTSSSAPPPLTAMRCVPTRWTRLASSQPRLVWDNGGGGGRPASIWIVNSLGTAHVTVGFDAPTHADGILELVPASQMLPEDVLDPRAGCSKRADNNKAVNNSSGADNKEGLRGRAAMFESVAREQREREAEATRRAQAALNARGASGDDLLTGAVDFLTGGGVGDPEPPPRHAVDHRRVYEAWLEEDERPTHNAGDPFGLSGGRSPARRPPRLKPRRVRCGWAAGGATRTSIPARMDPLGGLGGLGVPSAPAPAAGRRRLTRRRRRRRGTCCRGTRSIPSGCWERCR